MRKAKKKRKEKRALWKPRRKEKENRRASLKSTGLEEAILPKFPEKQGSPRTRETHVSFSIGSNDWEEQMEE